MAGTKRLAINVLMNWAAMAVNMVVPFFLTPFVVRHLGPAGYGVWILVVSTVSYLALLDLGLRSAVVRFVSKAQARGDLGEASNAIHVALWFRLVIAGGVCLLSFVLAALVGHMFKIPRELVYPAQVTTVLCALGVAVTLVSGVFGAVLAANHRFDLLSYITVVQTLIRASGVLLILWSGRGLVALAGWELTVLALVAVVTTGLALKVYPFSRVRLGKPDMTVLRRIWSYSFATFIFMVAVQIVTNTDNMVVGAFLSVSTVTLYAIGGSLIGYAQQVSGALSGTFTPLASGYEASGRYDQLRTMLIRGTQSTLALALPVAVALFFRGETFIDLWMGPQYGPVSSKVLRILLISMFFAVADSTAGSIMMAIEKHKPVANNALFEAFFNLALSLVLVKTIGIYGVAWGTAISMALTHIAFWPRYNHKILGVKPSTFILEGWGKALLCAVPFAVVSAAADRYWHPQHMVVFFAQILATLPVYALTVLLVFRDDCRALFAKWRSSRTRAVAVV